MKKQALIIHGWPRPVSLNHPLSRLLQKRNYEVISPNLFDTKFDLDFQNIISSLRNTIKGKKIDLIIGISMGGLLLPHLVSSVPKSKLIFIASSTQFIPNSHLIQFFIRYNLIRLIPSPALIFKIIPKSILNFIFSILSPFHGNSRERSDYIQDRDDNFQAMSKLTSKKCMQILSIVQKIDNTALVKNITNHTLIISGESDPLMPYKNAEYLHHMIPKSKIYKSDGSGHFGVLNKESLNQISSFI